MIIPEIRDLIKVIEMTSDLIMICNEKEEIIYINSAFEETTGFLKKEILGKTPRILKSGIHKKKFYKKMWKSLLAGKVYSESFCNKKKNGELYWVSKTVVPIMDATGKIRRIISLDKDITKIKFSESLFLDAEKIANIGNYKLDIEKNSWSNSKQLDLIFGIDSNYERSVEGWIKLIDPKFTTEISNHFHEQVLGKRQNFDKKYQIINQKTGEKRWVHGLGKLSFDAQDNPKHLIGTIRDITSEEQMLEQIQILEEAIKQSPVSIVLTNLKGEITYVNPKFENLTGYKLAEVVGKNPRVLKSDNKSHPESKTLWETITSGKQWVGNFRNKKKNGELYWERAIISPIINKAKEITHFLAIKEDITKQKELESQLSVEANDNLVSQIRLLSTQINPHFMFNALNSVQNYILGKNIEPALKFVADFSELMRSVLRFSMHTFIPIEQEIVFLRKFLELEKIRLNHKFDFTICIENELEEEEIFIPPMLLQPYIENAVIHGIGSLVQDGFIRVNFKSISENFVLCTIIDNGIGRKKALELKLKNTNQNKSYGMEITSTRLNLLNTYTGGGFSVNIHDELEESGTRIEITFPKDLPL